MTTCRTSGTTGIRNNHAINYPGCGNVASGVKLFIRYNFFDFGQLIRSDVVTGEECLHKAYDLGLIIVAEDGSYKIFLTGKGGRKGATKGLGALDIADFPDSTLAQ